MNSPVQKIKEILSIEEVVSSYIKIEKAGASLKAKCPFHQEKTPSFFLSPDRGSYYCFGCGVSGDIFTFVQEFEGLDFKGALKLLAERAGVPLDSYIPEGETASQKDRLYLAMKEASLYFVENLKANKKAIEYLHARGLIDKTIEEFKIGLAKAEWRELQEYLSKAGFTNEEMEKAGLIKKPLDKPGYYDRFRARIMFPISDSSGRVIAFSGRTWEAPKEGEIDPAKYLNSPETPIFTKSSVLYALDRAKETIRKNNFSILVEGQMDLVLSHQAGFRNTVATSGTALTDATLSKENVVSNLGLLRRLSSNIVLAFDGDEAGMKACGRAGRIALSLGMDVKVATIPEGMDPADIILKEGADKWKEIIRNSKHLIEALLDRALKNSGGDLRKSGRLIKEEILPYVAVLESLIEKMYFIKKISDISGIEQKALEGDLRKIELGLSAGEKEFVNAGSKEPGKTLRKDYILDKLLGIVLWQRGKGTIDLVLIMSELQRILKMDPEILLKEREDRSEDLIFQAEVFYGENQDIAGDIAELLANLEEESLQEELFRKMQDLKMAESRKDQVQSAMILKEVSDLNNALHIIKNKRFKNNK